MSDDETNVKSFSLQQEFENTSFQVDKDPASYIHFWNSLLIPENTNSYLKTLMAILNKQNTKGVGVTGLLI